MLDLQAYRDRLEGPMEGLAGTLGTLGIATPMTDAEMVTFATRKLAMLHEMLLVAGLPPGILLAAMKE